MTDELIKLIQSWHKHLTELEFRKYDLSLKIQKQDEEVSL